MVSSYFHLISKLFELLAKTAPLWSKKTTPLWRTRCCGEPDYKMLINKLHFLNSCHHTAGKFSCAVDCFLETWIHCVSNLFVGNNFTSYCIGSLQYVTRQFEDHQNKNSEASVLCSLREVFWQYLRLKCPSFVPMNCNAQFSENFQSTVFCDMSVSERNKIFSNYFFSVSCSTCNNNFQVSNEVLINFTCAINSNENWILIDDLHDSCNLFNSLDSLYSSNSSGWFFGIYVKHTHQDNALNHQSQNFDIFTDFQVFQDNKFIQKKRSCSDNEKDTKKVRVWNTQNFLNLKNDKLSLILPLSITFKKKT